MPVDSLVVPLLPGIEKVCAELGLHEPETTLEEEKDVLVEVSDKDFHEPSINVEVIDVFDSPPDKGQTKEVFKSAQESTIANLENLAQEEEKEEEISIEKDEEPEQKHKSPKELVVIDGNGATELNKSSTPEWLQSRIAYPEP